MRVAIDVSILSSPLTGIGRFAVSLVRRLAGSHENAEWVLLGLSSSVDGLSKGPNVVVHRTPALAGSRRMAWQQVALPRLASRYGAQVLHCPDFSRPLVCSVPIVNTIHDLSYYNKEAYFPLTKLLYKRSMARWTMKKSAALIAVSEFTRQEILSRFPDSQTPVFVARNAVDPVQQQSRLRPEYPFLLFVGTLETRKNVVRLVEAYSSLRTRERIAHRLVLAGGQGWGGKEILAAIQKSACKEDIEARGYVSQGELERLYQSTDAFIYPSLYEGFGLPILEAMAHGAPVICSDIAPHREVAADAADYFDPHSTASLAEAMERVLGSSGRQEALRIKGYRRVELFSWEDCARRHIEVYASVAGQRRGFGAGGR